MTSFTEEMEEYLARHDHRHPRVQAFMRHAYIVGVAEGLRAAGNPSKEGEITGLLLMVAREAE